MKVLCVSPQLRVLSSGPSARRPRLVHIPPRALELYEAYKADPQWRYADIVVQWICLRRRGGERDSRDQTKGCTGAPSWCSAFLSHPIDALSILLLIMMCLLATWQCERGAWYG
jgi:integrase